MNHLNFLPDSVWLERQRVDIGSADFFQCVHAAVARVDGVAVEQDLYPDNPQYRTVRLRVDFPRPIPNVGAFVLYEDQRYARVSIGRHGAYQPDWVKNEVKPVVKSLADAIQATCGGK